MRGPLPSHRPGFPATFLEEAAKMVRQRTVPYPLRQRVTLGCSCLNNRGYPTSQPPPRDSCRRVLGNGGVAAGPREPFPWTTRWDGAARLIFPPLDHALVKAVACARVAETQQPGPPPLPSLPAARARPSRL